MFAARLSFFAFQGTPMNLKPILAGAFLATSALAQHPAPRNAAVDYWRAGYLQAQHAPAKDGESPLRKADFTALGDNLDPAKFPPEFQEARKAVSPEALADYIHASTAETCDFQLDMSKGPYLLMPHLGLIRDLARAARIEARARLMDGKADEAADLIAAMFRSSGHVAADGILINSLVSVAIAVQAAQETQVLAASGKLSDKAREQILAAIKSLDAKDPFNMLGAMKGESRMFLPWIRTQIGPAGGADLVRIAKELHGKDDPSFAQIGRMSPEEAKAELDRLEAYYAKVISAWTAPEPVPAIQKLDEEAKSGAHGFFAQTMAPALTKARESEQKGVKAVRDAEQALIEKK
jgi:hypothetical protein